MAKTTKPSAGRPARTDKDNKTVASVERGTKPGDKRKTYIVDIGLSDKIDAIAYWDRVNVKDVVHEAFSNHVGKYEKAKGPIKPVKK